MIFVAFYEKCEWEGETWRFWLQVDGNEEVIESVRRHLANYNDSDDDDDSEDSAWELSEEVLPEYDVNILVNNSMSGYMAYEHKVVGIMSIPDDFHTDLEQFLNKGGIRDMFSPPEPTALSEVVEHHGSVYFYIQPGVAVTATFDLVKNQADLGSLNLDIDHNGVPVGVEALINDVQRIAIDGKVVWSRE